MTTTNVELFRSLRRSDWDAVPDTAEGAFASRVLHPSFVSTSYTKGPKHARVTIVRDADVTVVTHQGQNYVQHNKRGTSLFADSNVMGPMYREFRLPKGTEIPDSLRVRYTHRNATYDSDHYQIETGTGAMEIEAFKGALDNLARNAIVRAVALANA